MPIASCHKRSLSLTRGSRNNRAANDSGFCTYFSSRTSKPLGLLHTVSQIGKANTPGETAPDLRKALSCFCTYFSPVSTSASAQLTTNTQVSAHPCLCTYFSSTLHLGSSMRDGLSHILSTPRVPEITAILLILLYVYQLLSIHVFAHRCSGLRTFLFGTLHIFIRVFAHAIPGFCTYFSRLTYGIYVLFSPLTNNSFNLNNNNQPVAVSL